MQIHGVRDRALFYDQVRGQMTLRENFSRPTRHSERKNFRRPLMALYFYFGAYYNHLDLKLFFDAPPPLAMNNDLSLVPCVLLRTY